LSEWYDDLTSEDIFQLIARCCVVTWGLLFIVLATMTVDSGMLLARYCEGTLLASSLFMILSGILFNRALLVTAVGSIVIVYFPMPSERLQLIKLITIWILMFWVAAHESRWVKRWPHELVFEQNPQGDYGRVDALDSEDALPHYQPPDVNGNDSIQTF